jgi:ribosomal-protein-alanine N-acetyltransferase
MAAWRLRPATSEDAPSVVGLEAAAFGAASWGAQAVADGLSARHVETLLALDADDAPAGFVFWRRSGDAAEILSIGVDPARRREGCARTLLDAVIERCRANGARQLFLEVGVANAAAHGLYSARGFEPIGRRKRYYRGGGDALVMRLDL